MSYRGGDLELRTPQGLPASKRSPSRDEQTVNGWRALPDDRSSSYHPLHEETSEPIWVDDVVMECCNQAFELASAHRAADVRLDHLLHALTVVEGSLTLLEQKGIRAAPMRRETGARIIGDIPLPAGAPPPRRSVELQKTLSRASEWAYARRRPVSVLDLISVLLQSPRDWPGVDLVHEYADEWATREAAETRERERIRVVAMSQYTGDAAAAPTPPAYGPDTRAPRLQDQPPPAPREEPHVSAELISAVTQVGERLQAINGLERRLADFGQMLTGLGERLGTIERTLRDETEGHHNGFAAVSDRLGAVEQTLGGIQPERAIGAMESRLADIERQGIETGLLIAAADETLKAVAARATAEPQRFDTQHLVQDLKAELSSVTAVLDHQRTDIISAISQTVRESLPVGEPQALPILDIPEVREIPQIIAKLTQAETALGTLDGRVTTSSQSVTHELGQLGLNLNRELGQFHDNLIKLNVNQKTIAEGMDQWRLDTTADLGTLNGRLEELERTSAKMMQAQETLLASVQAVHRHATRWQDRRQRLRQALLGDGTRTRWFGNKKSETPVVSAAETAPPKPNSFSRVRASQQRTAAWVNDRMTRAREFARFRPRKA
jgi:hypothetical protein